MTTPFFSILIPVYNNEQYLHEALDSTLKQTYSDFEVIICNDGSTDNTLNIIKNYASKDPRIHFFSHVQNKGEFSTRIDLMEMAKGEYITWIDGDDTMDANFLEIGKQYLNKRHYDILCFDYRGKKHKRIKNIELNGKQVFEYCSKNFICHLWGNFYKKNNLFNKLDKSIYLNLGGDVLINIPLFYNAQSIRYVNKRVYTYYHSRGGANSLEKNFESIEKLKKYLEVRNYFLEQILNIFAIFNISEVYYQYLKKDNTLFNEHFLQNLNKTAIKRVPVGEIIFWILQNCSESEIKIAFDNTKFISKETSITNALTTFFWFFWVCVKKWRKRITNFAKWLFKHP